MFENLSIVLVEDEHANQRAMTNFLNELFPGSKLEILSTGKEAIDYLLSPDNEYNLVILDGNLKPDPTSFKAIDGPEVAAAMKKKGIDVTVVLWTNDSEKLEQFDKVFGERQHEIEKPGRKTNIQVVLTPIVQSIIEIENPNQSFKLIP